MAAASLPCAKTSLSAWPDAHVNVAKYARKLDVRDEEGRLGVSLLSHIAPRFLGRPMAAGQDLEGPAHKDVLDFRPPGKVDNLLCRRLEKCIESQKSEVNNSYGPQTFAQPPQLWHPLRLCG